MLKVTPCSRSQRPCTSYASSSHINKRTNLTAQRTFASHISLRQEPKNSIRIALSKDKNLKFTSNPNSIPKIFEEVDIEKHTAEMIEKLKKRGITPEGGAFIGPVPDGLELLAWFKIEEEGIKLNMRPEKRKKIEELAAKGDPLSQRRLKQIQDYESRLGLKKTHE